MLQGINFAFEACSVPFVVETNALGVVNLVKLETPIVTTNIGLIINDIVDHLHGDFRGSVVYVPREANFVTHTLSKMALDAAEDFFWLED